MRKKVYKIIKYGLEIIGTCFVSLMVLSAYMTLKPPASVLTTLFRMSLQITICFLIPLLSILILFYIVYRVRAYRGNKKCSHVTAVCIIILGICLIGASCQGSRLSHAVSLKSNLNYKAVSLMKNETATKLELKKDYSKELKVDECKVYRPKKSNKKGTCLIYLNYGGWQVQDESMGQQIYQFCDTCGYSFVRFAKAREKGEKIDSMVRDANVALKTVIENEKFQKVYLCGGSAGGHLALLSAFVDEENIEYEGVVSLPVDGVIALYPCVDPAYTYDYFTKNKSENLIDHAGDWVYCSLMKENAGSLSKATKQLDEDVFGARKNADSWYEKSAIKNVIEDKDIPVLIVQGSYDSMMPTKASKELYHFLKKKKKSAAYLELPGTDHVFDLMPTLAWNRTEKEINGFINTVSKKEVTKTKQKDYDLPVSKTEKSTYEADVCKTLKNYIPILKKYHCTEPENLILEDEILQKIASSIGKKGDPVFLYNGSQDMIHYEKVETFMKAVNKKLKATLTMYQVNQNGGFMKIILHAVNGTVTETSISAGWNTGLNPCMHMVSRCKVVNLKYTKKGWLYIEVAVPKSPEEVYEEVDGTTFIRVKPFKKEYRTICEKYIKPIGYQGNNMFLINWDTSHMEKLAFNDIYEFLYSMKTHKEFDSDHQSKLIKEKDFEDVILSFFSISKEKLRTIATYDSKNKGYAWMRFGFGTFLTDMDCYAEPEVVGVTRNKNGTLEIMVDAVWDDEGLDQAFCHIVTIREEGDGTCTYLGNRIVKQNIEKMTDYKYRTK